jgi:DNA polymerase III subunit delta'
MSFSHLIGNELAKSALQRMAEQKCVPNALLFYGPDGVGKSLFALSLCGLLMGLKHVQKLTSLNHPDLHLYSPEGKSAIHTMENMRKLISEVALPPYNAPVKIFIIHDAHQMLPYSSNSLLKTLEEPSFDSYFILLTDCLEEMLPTLVSRCRKVPFFPIPQAEIEALLKEKGKVPEEARRIAFLSHGSMAKAWQLSQNSQLPWRSSLLEILCLHLPYEYPRLQKLSAELEQICVMDASEKEEEDRGTSSILSQTDAIFEEIAAWYRDLQLLKEGIATEYLYHLDSIDRLQLALSRPFFPLERVLDQIAKSRLALQRSIKLRNVIENFFLLIT